MYLVIKTSAEEIAKLKLKPDPHTVSLKDKGQWFALTENNEILSLLCIREQMGELYIGEVFTPMKYRNHGYMTELIRYVSNDIFRGFQISTHALKSSKHCFERCGFREYKFRHFKYGDQYWMRREGKKL